MTNYIFGIGANNKNIFGLNDPHAGTIEPSEFGTGPLCYVSLYNSIIAERGLAGNTHVRNSAATYVDPADGLVKSATTNIPRFESVGGHRAILLEPVGTNNLLYARNLTQGEWAETNCTTAKDQVGEDGVANSASSLLATAGNATVLQTLTLADTDYAYSVSIKRITGTGNIEVTDDNGGTWTDIKASLSTTAWYRHTITRSQANPVCGIRIVTDADKIAVDYNQLEAGKVGSSRILTTTGAATRATESGYPLWTLPVGLFDAQGTCSVWVRFGWGETDMPQDTTTTNSGIIVTRDNASSLVFVEQDSDFVINASFSSFDGTTWAMREYNFIANTWYKLIVKWSSTTLKMQVGVDTGAGVVWGAEETFDGAYDITGNLFRLAYGLFGPMWMRDLRLYDRVLFDSQINSLGSP